MTGRVNVSGLPARADALDAEACACAFRAGLSVTAGVPNADAKVDVAVDDTDGLASPFAAGAGADANAGADAGAVASEAVVVVAGNGAAATSGDGLRIEAKTGCWDCCCC